MSTLRGAKTSKRWWLSIRLAFIISVIGLFGMGFLAAVGEWALFSNIVSVTIISLAGLGTGYTMGESWRPHNGGDDNTVIIQQGYNNTSYNEDAPLPPKPNWKMH